MSPSAANRACNDTILSFRSVLNRLSSSAKRRTCSGSMIACAIVSLSVCVCGSPGRPLLQRRAPDLTKPALFLSARQILTNSPAFPRAFSRLVAPFRCPLTHHVSPFTPGSFGALRWLSGGFRVALGWLWGRNRLAINRPWGGSDVALSGSSISFAPLFSLQSSTFQFQHFSIFSVSCLLGQRFSFVGLPSSFIILIIHHFAFQCYLRRALPMCLGRFSHESPGGPPIGFALTTGTAGCPA